MCAIHTLHCSMEQLIFPYVLFRDWIPVERKQKGKRIEKHLHQQREKKGRKWMNEWVGKRSGGKSSIWSRFCSLLFKRGSSYEVLNEKGYLRVERKRKAVESKIFGDRSRASGTEVGKLDSERTDRSSNQTNDPLSLSFPHLFLPGVWSFLSFIIFWTGQSWRKWPHVFQMLDSKIEIKWDSWRNSDWLRF